MQRVTDKERFISIASAQLLCDLAGLSSELDDGEPEISRTVARAFVHAIENGIVDIGQIRRIAERADEDIAQAAMSLRWLAAEIEICATDTQALEDGAL